MAKQKKVYPYRDGLFYDPVEDTEKFKKAMEIIEPKLPPYEHMGDCFRIWYLKKKMLREEFGIRWKTPEELNRETLFD